MADLGLAVNHGGRSAVPRAPDTPTRTSVNPPPVSATPPTEIMRRRLEREQRLERERAAAQRQQQHQHGAAPSDSRAEHEHTGRRRRADDPARKRTSADQRPSGTDSGATALLEQVGAMEGDPSSEYTQRPSRRAEDSSRTYPAESRRDRAGSSAAAPGQPLSQPQSSSTIPPKSFQEPTAASESRAAAAAAAVANPGVPSRTRATSAAQAASRTTAQGGSRAASTGNYPPQQTQASQSRLTSGPGATNRAQGGPSAAASSQRQQSSHAGAKGTGLGTGTGEGRGSTNGHGRNGQASSFPHAFERWETLSSHWEGLTSFWMKRLETNSEELNAQPLNQQLARQVTDLSAAGANLFHAVVELQRLRASSERKFQRWFFETRAEQERTQERIAQLERELQVARENARAESDPPTPTPPANERDFALEAFNAEALARAETERQAAVDEVETIKRGLDQQRREMREMRRELEISRNEARRAWEEIGRNEQAERDRTFSLKRGEPTLVGGVQVVPMAPGGPGAGGRGGGHSRQTSASQGYDASTAGGLSSHPVQPPSDISEGGAVGGGLSEPGFSAYDPGRSETDTDPYTEDGRETSTTGIPSSTGIPRRPVPAYPPASATTTASRAGAQQASAPTTASRHEPASSVSRRGEPQVPPFYQQQGAATTLHEGAAPAPHVPRDADARSYIPSTEDGEGDSVAYSDEYELDMRGEVVRDAQGHPVRSSSLQPVRGDAPSSGITGVYRGPASDDSDEYNVGDQLERERLLRQHYGVDSYGVPASDAPVHPRTASAGQPSTTTSAHHTSASSTAARPTAPRVYAPSGSGFASSAQQSTLPSSSGPSSSAPASSSHPHPTPTSHPHPTPTSHPHQSSTSSHSHPASTQGSYAPVSSSHRNGNGTASSRVGYGSSSGPGSSTLPGSAPHAGHNVGVSSSSHDPRATGLISGNLPSLGSGPSGTGGAEGGSGTGQASHESTTTASTSSTGPPGPDYSGSGYGSGSGWESVFPRHHHPTRLSDVLEEDDERSRTSPSRASERSRGLR